MRTVSRVKNGDDGDSETGSGDKAAAELLDPIDEDAEAEGSQERLGSFRAMGSGKRRMARASSPKQGSFKQRHSLDGPAPMTEDSMQLAASMPEDALGLPAKEVKRMLSGGNNNGGAPAADTGVS